VSALPDEHATPRAVPCGAWGCTTTSSSLLGHEVHTHLTHGHVCAQCARTHSSDHLLGLHLSESHGAGACACAVLSCTHVFPTAKERLEHLHTAHGYPRNFRFLRPPKKKKSSKKDAVASVEATDALVDDIGGRLEDADAQVEEDAMQLDQDPDNSHHADKQEIPKKGSKNIPKTFSFGRGVKRGFITHHRRPATMNADMDTG